MARPESWHTSQGVIEGRIAAVYGPVVVLARSGGSAFATVDQLDDEELSRVVDYLSTHPARSKWRDSKTRLGRAVQGNLRVLEGDRLTDFDPGDRLEPEFYLIYFGAGWCGPCRRFSKVFVPEYQQLKEALGDRFEVIFASWDESEADQRDYAWEAHMPWPMLEFSVARHIRTITHWEGPGIPCLVLLTPDGDLIAHTYDGSEFTGPETVLESFRRLLAAISPTPATRRAMFRLAVAQRLRAAAGKSLPPKPYLVGLDMSHYQTLEASRLTATLQLDAQGKVEDATFEPKQPAVIDYSLVTDAQEWLFLPAVKNGKPVAETVTFPIVIDHAKAAAAK